MYECFRNHWRFGTGLFLPKYSLLGPEDKRPETAKNDKDFFVLTFDLLYSIQTVWCNLNTSQILLIGSFSGT